MVVVADDVASGTEVQKFLQDFGFTNVRLYLDGIKKWEEIGGSVEFPKGISFEVKSELKRFPSINPLLPFLVIITSKTGVARLRVNVGPEKLVSWI